MKLQLFLSHNGILSRRKALEAIQAGEVKVNGRQVKEPSTEIATTSDRVTWKGYDIVVKNFDYIALNKPAGYVTTCEQQFDQRTVMQLLPKELQHVRPVGRLEKDSEGLLILTNDGELANRVSHPSFEVEKTYYARVKWEFTDKTQQCLAAGVQIPGDEDEQTENSGPVAVKIVRASAGESEIELTIKETKERRLRRLLDVVGHPVIQLRRLGQGPVKLENLRSADFRRLTEEELNALSAITRPAQPAGGRRNKYIDNRQTTRREERFEERDSRSSRRPEFRSRGRFERREGGRPERSEFRRGPEDRERREFRPREPREEGREGRGFSSERKFGRPSFRPRPEWNPERRERGERSDFQSRGERRPFRSEGPRREGEARLPARQGFRGPRSERREGGFRSEGFRPREGERGQRRARPEDFRPDRFTRDEGRPGRLRPAAGQGAEGTRDEGRRPYGREGFRPRREGGQGDFRNERSGERRESFRGERSGERREGFRPERPRREGYAPRREGYGRPPRPEGREGGERREGRGFGRGESRPYGDRERRPSFGGRSGGPRSEGRRDFRERREPPRGGRPPHPRGPRREGRGR